MSIFDVLRHLAMIALVAFAAGCTSLSSYTHMQNSLPTQSAAAREKANDVVIYALGLLETDYRFGGKNPDAGLDCSGMISYVYKQAVGLSLKGSAADIARQGRAVERGSLQPGDLVFFNTTGAPFSHVGIYIGDQRFVHAPSNGGKVRTDSLMTGWFSSRVEATRTYFD